LPLSSNCDLGFWCWVHFQGCSTS